MGRPLFRLAGQDLRKRPAGTLPPRSAHLPRTPPNPSVRVHAACVLAPGPFGIGPPDLAGHRIGPARRATRPADRRPAPVRLQRLGQTARRIPERRPDVGSGQRRRRAARQLHPPSTPVKVQTGAGRARWRASRSSAVRSVAGGGTRDASPCTRTEGRLGKRWLRTTRSGFAIRASADRPTILSRGPARQPAAAKQRPPGLPCADDTTGTASGRRGNGASPRDDGLPSSIPGLARRRRRPDPARPRRGPPADRPGRCRASRRPGGRPRHRTAPPPGAEKHRHGRPVCRGYPGRSRGPAFRWCHANARVCTARGQAMSGNDRRQRRPPRPVDRIGREMSKFGLHAMLCGTELDLLQVWNVDRSRTHRTLAGSSFRKSVDFGTRSLTSPFVCPVKPRSHEWWGG